MKSGILICIAVLVFSLASVAPAQQPLTNFDSRPAVRAMPASARGEVDALRQQLPDVQIEADGIVGSPAYVRRSTGFLTGLNGAGGAVAPQTAAAFAVADPDRPLKAFLREHAALFGHGPEALADARAVSAFVTPHSGLRTAAWQQQVDGIPLFEALLTAHTTRNGELVSVASQFVPDPAAAAGVAERAAAAAPALAAASAVAVAANNVGEATRLQDVSALDAASAGAEKAQRFAAAGVLGAAEAKLVWLPMNRTSLRLCWDVILTSRARGEMFRVLIDAETGKPWIRRCLTVYASDASYRVFTSDSPSPFSPGLSSPGSDQPPVVSRSFVTLTALSTNASPSGWINDGDNTTLGNNVDAHLDLDANDVPDPGSRPVGAPFRVFDFSMDLAQEPATYTNASVVQLFYLNNWMHDKLYELGFTEAAGNFQNNNFGRGGLGNDAVQADAQDGSGKNNANFSTPSDGSAPRMQMYIFTGPTPDRDGALDAETVLHEYTHGLSFRRVGGGVGMGALQTGGMGEGWSDFYPLSLLSETNDDPNACYPCGGYASYRIANLTQNYYFGVRRYPYSTDMTKNPLTFKDLDPAQASAHTWIPRNPVIGNSANEVHNMGELWCVTLWEARARLIAHYGAAAGNWLMLQLVTDGMNLSPAKPTYLQARDAIIQADQVDTGGANRMDLWIAFAKRGMGWSATCPASSTTTGIVEAYDIPDDLNVTPTASFTSAGIERGPFLPSNQVYTLTNSGASNLTWTAGCGANWVNVAPVGGDLVGGASTSVTVAVNANANGFGAGAYIATVAFSNAASGVTQTRPVVLTVQGSIFFTTNSYRVGEAGGTALITVTRAGNTNLEATVDFVTSNGTATAGSDDYVATNGTLAFAAGETLKSFGVTILDDAVAEGNETVKLALSNPTGGGTLGDPSTARLTIVDNDALPINLYDGSSYLWDIQQNGSIADGSANAYDGGHVLSDFPKFTNCLLVAGGCEVVIGAATNAGVATTRRIYVPTNQAYARFLEVLRNVGASTVTKRVRLDTNLGSDSSTVIVRTSDGDTVFEKNDNWIVTDDTDGSGSPTVLHVIANDRGYQRPSVVSYSTGQLGYEYKVVLNPGETKIVMHFGSQNPNRNTATNKAPQLTELGLGALSGISAEELAQIVNFGIADDLQVNPSDGLSSSRFLGGPFSPSNKVYTVTNGGGSNLTWGAECPSNWVTVAPSGGTLAAGTSTNVTMSINVNANSLGVGVYSATVAFSNADSGVVRTRGVVLLVWSTNLTLSLPASGYEGRVFTNSGRVEIDGTLASNLAVTLTSDDEMTVANSVTIPAGKTFANFNVTLPLDGLTDGVQTGTVTANAAGFGSGSAAMLVQDADVDHFVFGAISSPQTSAVPFSVRLAAADVNGATITVYRGSAGLSGAGDGGLVTMTPTKVVLTNGLWGGSVRVNTPDANVRLTADDGSGHSGTSGVFTVYEFDAVAIEVVSAHGGAVLNGLGVQPGSPNCFARGTVVVAAITNSPVSGGAGTQYVCVAGSVAGNAYTQVSPTNVTLTVTNDATLTWIWSTNYWLATTNVGMGTVAPPSGWQGGGSNVGAMATPAQYYHFSQWSGSGTNFIVIGTLNSATVTVRVLAPANLDALFAENLATNETPEWWLVKYGLTNRDWDVEAMDDQDHDGMPTWQERIADTDPTNKESVLLVTGLAPELGGLRVEWKGGCGATQFLQYCGDLGTTNCAWIGIFTNLPPTAIVTNFLDTWRTNRVLFYRIKAER